MSCYHDSCLPMLEITLGNMLDNMMALLCFIIIITSSIAGSSVGIVIDITDNIFLKS